MVDVDRIKVTGLAEFTRSLRKLDKNLPKGLRLAHNEAAQIVVDWAKPRVPRDSGGAAGTVKARSSRTMTRVSGGSARYPYYPWLDFGGAVGPHRSVRRQFIKEGRYIYPGYTTNRDQVHEALLDALLRVAREAGVEVVR